MLESEQQQQLTDGRSLGGCQQTNAVTAQQQQLTFLVTTQQPLPSVGHVIGQPQSVQNQSCYISTGQVTSALNCVSSPVPSRTTSTPHTHSSAIPSPSSLSVQSTNGGQCSVQLRGTASCPPQSLSNPSALSSTRVNAPSPVQTSSNAIGTVPHFQRQHSVSFTTGASSHAEHLRCTTNTNFDGEYDNVHRQQPIICDVSSQQMYHNLQLHQARQQHILPPSRIQQHQQQQQKCLKQSATINQQSQHQNSLLQQQQQMLHCQQTQVTLQQQQFQVLQQPQQQQNFPHQPQIVQQKQQIQQSQHGYVQFSLQKQLKKHFIQQRDDGDEEEEDVQQRPVTAKEEYRELKHRFKFLVYENECYQEELRNLQRKLLKLSRDKNFLLDRLLLYEKLSDSSDESDSSVKTVEEKVPPKKKSRPPASRRRSTNARAKGANNTSCIDSDATKISVMEQQQQVQKQSLEQPSEQHRLPLQPTATSCIGVPVCSSSETGTGEQRAAVSVPICCSSERNIKREETVIGPPATENAFFEENRSVQFSSSTFTSSR
uniref:INO80 complex subunit E n=1 Tax=Wuchereria bancrofti TaxID=6293 RepID=A0AAF5PPE0_WUCBA